jgi:hypothetical protein
MARSANEQIVAITANAEMFRSGPGYDPLNLEGDAAKLAVPPLQWLLRTRIEAGRGGRMDITQFVSPGPDTAMHFFPGVIPSAPGRYRIADLLATVIFCATLTHDTAPSIPLRSGIYYHLPPQEGRHEYRLGDSMLLVGRPQVYPTPEPALQSVTDRTDDHSAEACRVLSSTAELGEAVGIFGKLLGLKVPKQDMLVQHITDHTIGAQLYRQTSALGEALMELRY